MRVGIISGNWGMAAHLPAWRALPDVEVVGVCTAHQDTAEAAAKANDIPMAFWDYRDLIAHPEIDLVDVGTRPDLRFDMCLAALAAGKHVYNAVPFSDTIEHARTLRDTAAGAGSITAVDAYSEHLPPIALAKEIVADGGIGEVYMVNCSNEISLFDQPRSDFPYNWFQNGAHATSALRNLGSHALHVVYSLFGDIESVVAQDRQYVRDWAFTDAPGGLTPDPEVTDTAAMLFRLESGGIGTFTASWVPVHGSGFTLDAFGSRGHLRLRGQGTMPTNATKVYYAGLGSSEGLVEVAVPGRLTSRDGIGLSGQADQMLPKFAMAVLFRQMIDAAQGHGRVRPDFADAYQVQAIIEAARRSAVVDAWVRPAAL
ncbi:Gfo/Idh/MocA family protein [Jatrophihabitans sp. DSM 45814]